jgi:hypothetical protein
MRKSRGVKSSGVLMLAVAAAAVMLNAGCEDSELSRLLGLSKKKNDAVVQPQESSNNSAVENADGSNQDGKLQQTQSDGNANGQANDGESQTPTSENSKVQEITPTSLLFPSDKNYKKVIQIAGTKHPNDMGYAGVWEIIDTTPPGTEKSIYGTQTPNQLGEVGTWAFVPTRTTVYVRVQFDVSSGPITQRIYSMSNKTIQVSYPDGNAVPYQVPNTAMLGEVGYQNGYRNRFGGTEVNIVQRNLATANGTIEINACLFLADVSLVGSATINAGTKWYYLMSVEQEYPESARPADRLNVWRKTGYANPNASSSIVVNGVNTWGRTQ